MVTEKTKTFVAKMVRYNVHSVPVKTDFQTSLCSKATLFYVVCTILTTIPPFLIAYRSEGFWKRLDWYTEQPRITFKRQLLVLLETSTEQEFVAYSTYDAFNTIMDGHVKIPVIKFYENDFNYDGVNDMLDIQVEFYLNTEQVKSLTMILLFDYRLQKYCRFQMEGMAFIQGSSSLSGSEFYYLGDVHLYQKIALLHSGLDVRFNVPVIKSNSIHAGDYDFKQILMSYSARNVSMRTENVYTVWKTGRAPQQPFTVSVHLRYPEHIILYKPGFWQVLKWGWVQYVAILIVFIYVFRTIKTFVFKNQVLFTVVQQRFKHLS